MSIWFTPNKKVLGFDGEPATDEAGKEWTLGRVAGMALAKMDQAANGDVLAARFKLACKLYDSDFPVELTDKESVLLRERVATLGLPLFVGRVGEELDAKHEAPLLKANGDATGMDDRA